MTMFTRKAMKLIKQIPEGHVMTYGQIAGLIDHPRAARQVARLLHSMSTKYHLPWHRVINGKGQISLKGDAYNEQVYRLEEEGIEVEPNGIVDLSKYQWHPLKF